MCGRYAASADEAALQEVFQPDEVLQPPPRSWNLAPTDAVPAVVTQTSRDTGQRRRVLVAPRWGLVPSWAKGLGRPQVNARAETVASKPMFRAAFASRRCLLPADGYYEWQPVPGGQRTKQPYFIKPDTGLLVMAGIYEHWKNPATGTWLTSVAIITTEATDRLGKLHDRMPVTVEPTDWEAWLDPGLTDPQAVLGLLALTGERLAGYPVSAAVGNVRNDGPELVQPLEPA